MSFVDYYSILGVSSSASSKEIRFAYKRKCKLLHPDLNPGVDTTRSMQLLNEAYSVLQDRTRRFIYDKENGYNCDIYRFIGQRPIRTGPSYVFHSRFYETSSWSDDFEKRRIREPWFENTSLFFYLVEFPFYLIRDFIFPFVPDKSKKSKYRI